MPQPYLTNILPIPARAKAVKATADEAREYPTGLRIQIQDPSTVGPTHHSGAPTIRPIMTQRGTETKHCLAAGILKKK